MAYDEPDNPDVITQPDLRQPLPEGTQPPTVGGREIPDPVSLVPRLEGRLLQGDTDAMGIIRQQQQSTEQEIARRKALMEQQAPQRQQMLQAAQQPALTPDQMQDLQQPANVPQYKEKPVIEPEEFKNFFGMAFIMSAVLGKVFGADMTDGLNMLSSAMTGYMTGAKEKARNDAEQFKLKTESALNAQREKLLRYQQIIRARNMDLQQRMNALKLQATMDDDQQMIFALQQNNYGQALKYIEKQQEQTVKLIGQATTIWGKLDQHNKQVELQTMRSQDKAKALESLNEHRQITEGFARRGLDQKDSQAMRQVLQNWEKEYQTVVQNFERSTNAALLKAGGNQELLKALIEEDAQFAAQQMREFNRQILNMPLNGGAHFIFKSPEGQEVLETPEYWKRATQGFERVRQFVPPVVAYPQQSTPQYKGGGAVENPPVGGEEWIEQ